MSLVEGQTKDDLNQLRVEEEFYCPGCDRPVILKLGEKRRFHFAHQRDERCPYETEPETSYHQQGKIDLYKWAANQEEKVSLEYYLREIKQRPDIMVLSPFRQAIEYQCATMSPELIQKRIDGFHNYAIPSLWILGENRMQRISQSIFRLHDMDWFALHPLEISQYAIYYYCPVTKHIIQLTNIIPLTKTKIMAQLKSYPIQDFSYSMISLEDRRKDPIDQSVWLDQKTKWRLFSYKDKSRDSQYVKKLFIEQRLNLSQFPSYVGLPLANNILLRTPSYLWQGFIAIQLMKNNSAFISSQLLKQQLNKLVAEGIFTKNEGCRNKSLLPCIESYLEMLYHLNILEKQSDLYRLKPNHYFSTQRRLTTEELIVQDKQIVKNCEK